MAFLISLLLPRKIPKMLNHKQNLLRMPYHVSNIKSRNLRDIQLKKRAVKAPIPANPNNLLDCLAAAEKNSNEAQQAANEIKKETNSLDINKKNTILNFDILSLKFKKLKE